MIRHRLIPTAIALAALAAPSVASAADRDSDNDGRRDGREGAGKIKSFDAETGVLVIDRFRGSDLTGKVDSSTEIECEDHGRRHSGDDDGPNDTSGDGTPENGPGDTRGDGTPEDNPKVTAASDD